LAQFGINQMANLDNPLPGSPPAPRSREASGSVRTESPPRPRPEDNEPPVPVFRDRSGGGDQRRLDFYA